MSKEQYQKAVNMVLSYNEGQTHLANLIKSHVFQAYIHIFTGEPDFDITQFTKDCKCSGY